MQFRKPPGSFGTPAVFFALCMEGFTVEESEMDALGEEIKKTLDKKYVFW